MNLYMAYYHGYKSLGDKTGKPEKNKTGWAGKPGKGDQTVKSGNAGECAKLPKVKLVKAN